MAERGQDAPFHALEKNRTLKNPWPFRAKSFNFKGVNILFVLIGLIGIGLIYPLAFRSAPEKRKALLAAGIALLHVSIFGILWYSVPTYVILSFLLLETGVLLLLDPLKLLNETHRRRGILAGILCIGSSIVLSLAKVTAFPLWLWIFPIALYLASTLIKSENRYHYYSLILAVALTVAYLGVMVKKAYQLSDGRDEALVNPQPDPLPMPHAEIPGPVQSPQVLTPSGTPLTHSVQELDLYINRIEKEKVRLQEEVKSLQDQLNKLREENQKKLEKIEEIQDISKTP